MVGTSALTAGLVLFPTTLTRPAATLSRSCGRGSLTLSPRRGNDRSPSRVLRLMIRPIPSLESFRQRRTMLPLPGGEGRLPARRFQPGGGEGRRHHQFSRRCPHLLLPTQNSEEPHKKTLPTDRKNRLIRRQEDRQSSPI